MSNAQTSGNNTAENFDVHSIEAKDIGYLFAQDYYTYLNKDPSQLHCFYSKSSSCIHGVEGEVVERAHGQSEIHQVIMKHDFKNCKVHVTNIDTLPANANGIIVQVMGEMSNNNQPSQRFVQSFYLAEQPGGYYVHNDVMRFFKDEYPEKIDNTESLQAAAGEPAEEPQTPKAVEETKSDPAPEPAETNTLEEIKIADEAAPEQTLAETTTTAPETSDEISSPPPAAEEEKPIDEPSAISVPAETPVEPAKPEEKQQQSQPTPAAAPAPESTKPKSWANLAANNREKWGTAVAKIEGTVASVTHSANQSGPSSRGSTPAPSGQENRPNSVSGHAAANKTVSVSDLNGLDRKFLTEFIEKKYGPVSIKDLRRNNCLLVFKDEATAKKAIADKTAVVGEKKIKLDVYTPSSRRDDQRGSRGSKAGFRSSPADSESGHGGRRNIRRGERSGSQGGRNRNRADKQ
ncbi:hypothetical protein H4219_003358 [Mycoemilia scoparia]|uniref:NTF2 domain-containing protein n=1 Tax=Mycoemilia scoparia TaxID=417184 RepID=A0A9W7ZUZ5_9FUNG|nr:hypothetical protein H4219_003358 [Mycoemilia scoparia]